MKGSLSNARVDECTQWTRLLPCNIYISSFVSGLPSLGGVAGRLHQRKKKKQKGHESMHMNAHKLDCDSLARTFLELPSLVLESIGFLLHFVEIVHIV